MHPEGCLPFDLLFRLRTSVMVDVVVVDVFRALPAYEGSVGTQGQGNRPLVGTGCRRTGGPGSHQALDAEASARERPVFWRAGSRGMPDHGRGLAPGGLQDAGKVFVQDGLGVLVRGAREEG